MDLCFAYYVFLSAIEHRMHSSIYTHTQFGMRTLTLTLTGKKALFQILSLIKVRRLRIHGLEQIGLVRHAALPLRLLRLGSIPK